MQELRAEAKQAGVPVSEIRSAESVEELQGLIVGAGTNGGKGKAMVRKAVKKAVTKKTAPTKTVAKRRGRPPGSKNKTTKAPVKVAAKRGRPKGSVNKTTTRKPANGNGKRNVTSTDGRHVLSGVNYSRTDGWNPREGSAPDVILNALRRFKGDRDKVFNHLKSSVWDFVGRKMQDGSKRSLSSAHDMLKYRIARTDWDFALKTGQHEKSENRVEYGTGGTGTNTFKRGKTRKSTAQTAPKRRGRPPTKKTATATPKRRGRPPGSKSVRTNTAPKRRGRPPGSKNKPKTTTRKPRGIQVVAKRGPGRPRKS